MKKYLYQLSKILLLIPFLLLSGCKEGRDYIQIVGSFTIYPAMTCMAEKFATEQNFKTPIVEASGSGSGIRLFCEGTGYGSPDIVNSSRQIKASEIESCHKNHVDFQEIKLGYDAIVFARSKKSPIKQLTTLDLYKALARYIVVDGKIVANTNIKWSDINKAFPKIKIKIYGPTSVSGTRDAVTDGLLVQQCMQEKLIAETHSDEIERKGFCSLIRDDGGYIETSENDNLTALKLQGDKDAIGIVKFGFFMNNQDKVKAVKINGLSPSIDNIKEGRYPLHRVLYSYIKLNNLATTPGLKEFTKLLEQELSNKDSIFAKWGLLSLI